jgi:hypothetical protein
MKTNHNLGGHQSRMPAVVREVQRSPRVLLLDCAWERTLSRAKLIQIQKGGAGPLTEPPRLLDSLDSEDAQFPTKTGDASARKAVMRAPRVCPLEALWPFR